MKRGRGIENQKLCLTLVEFHQQKSDRRCGRSLPLSSFLKLLSLPTCSLFSCSAPSHFRMPLLSETSVLLLSCGFSASYLSSIYLIPSARVHHPQPTPPKQDPADIVVPPQEKRDRNHPSIIKSRLVAVSISSLSSLLSIPLILSHHSKTNQNYAQSLPKALELVGFILPRDWRETARMLSYPLGLTMTLFAGSLYVQHLEGDLPLLQRGGSWKKLKERFDGWRGVRNFIVVSFELSPFFVHSRTH